MDKILLDQLKRLDARQKAKRSGKSPNAKISGSGLKVYYGWTKTNKIRKREAISVIFENEPGAGNHTRYAKTLRKMQETAFVREQSEEEASDARHHNRVFSEYSIFLDDKAIDGDLEKALQVNFDADKNHVPEEVRQQIREKLRCLFLQSHR